MAEYQANIQRLARGPKLKAKLGAPRERDPIPGKVTPFTDDTFATASTAPAADNSSGDGCNTNENGSDQQQNDQVSDPNDPNTYYKGGAGSTESTEETGVQDIDSVMDGDTSSDQSDSYSSDPEPAIKGLTNLTDKDGNCFTVRMDGTFPTPDGWTDPDSPPADSSWIEGYYYKENATSGGSYITLEIPESFSTTLNQNKAEMESRLAQVLAEQDAQKPSLAPHSSPGVELINNSYDFTTQDKLGSQRVGSSSSRVACSQTPNAEHCVDEAPTEKCWPSSDGCYTLAYIDGTFQTNQYDCSAPKNWEPKSTIYDHENGVPKYAVTGTASGGHMIYKTNSDGTPDPTGTAKVYGPNGNMVAAGDATSQFMDQYLPK